MNADRLREILALIPETRIAVVGDFCLDAYWSIDQSASDRSIETNRTTRPVAQQRYALGGAGNVAHNLAALGIREVYAVGLVGDDLFGRELLRRLSALKVDTTGMLVQEEKWDTLVYAKPYLGDEEQHRIDFGNFNHIREERAQALVKCLQKVLERCQVIIINQQVRSGVHNDYMVRRLGEIITNHPHHIFLLDSRHRSADYHDIWLKLKAHEAVRLCGKQCPATSRVPLCDAVEASRQLCQRYRHPVFVTRGERGCLVAEGETVHQVPGIQILSPIDPVGAGDSMLAGIAAALAVGATPLEAACLGNFTAAVTVQKLQQTGTASSQEIADIGADADYVYNPELAEDAGRARFVPHTEFELVTELRPALRPSHVILDHDGTISTLRQGWEPVMESVMVSSIMGRRYGPADGELYHKVVDRVRDYIEKSTGIECLVQMQALAEMVRQFGLRRERDIRDAFGYKQAYDHALMKSVKARIGKLEKGRLSAEELTIKGAVEFLKALYNAGLKLYLTSGTDVEDVVREAEAVGYAYLFEGRIFGAVGDVTRRTKSEVVDQILTDIGTDAAHNGLITFGDGPVELRETHKRGGFAVGVASDEVRRCGLNPAKRGRLVRAGADLIIPDFSHLEQLLALLNIQPQKDG